MAKEESLLRTSSECCGSERERLKDAQVGSVRPPKGNMLYDTYTGRHIQGAGVVEVRKRLEMAIRTIPDGVRNGSVQNVQRWKEKAEHAVKLLRNPRAPQQDLQEALDDLIRNYK